MRPYGSLQRQHGKLGAGGGSLVWGHSEGGMTSFGAREVPPLPLACCVTLGKPLSLSGPIRTAHSFSSSLDFLETLAADPLCAERSSLSFSAVLTLQKFLRGIGVMA